jgi:DNA-3-methyladenine glycosylase
MPRKWGRRRYEGSALDLAPALIGVHLVHRVRGRLQVGSITETEAYMGPEDRASHARHGMTRRNQAMFGKPGVAYVYLVYGMWNCLNVVTGKPGDAQAVLLRGLRLLDSGEEIRGPGLLCRHLGVGLGLNGEDLCGRRLWLEDPPGPSQKRVLTASPRVGVDYAGAWAAKPWRFMEARKKS